ncbi:MAG: hypothetical protein GC199_02980 [Alphaproteobacteria bacterium]|nr:hypothetical protein [Alphaproteobacteria bacterium]
MKAKRKKKHQRKGTRFSKDGRTVFAWLRFDRRAYEFARWWAMQHADADPDGTAEDQLEGYSNTALLARMDDADWEAPTEIEALYCGLNDYDNSRGETDDEIPF